MPNINDEIIPPSPVAERADPKRRRKKRKTTKKHPRSILSSHSTNKTEEKINDDASLVENEKTNDDTPLGEEEKLSDDTPKIIEISSSDDDCGASSKPKCTNILYAGLDNDDDAVVSIDDNFDMMSEVKLLEAADENFMRNVTVAKAKPTKTCLISLKDLMNSQCLEECSPNTQAECSANTECTEIHELIDENLQFSEWPMDCENQDRFDLEESMSPIRTGSFVLNDSQATVEQAKSSDETTLVQSILSDFNCDNISSDEDIERTPPVILVRKQNPKTYQRPAQQIAKEKILIFNHSCEEANEATSCHEQNMCDDNSQSVDIDFDLDTSRQIKENMSSLSAFFTQPKNYELDFSTDLSQPEMDNQLELEEANNDEQLTVEQNNDQIQEFYNKSDDDLMLSDFKTPANLNKKRKRQICERMMHSTPSSSQQTDVLELIDGQNTRRPKRLKFDADLDDDKISSDEASTSKKSSANKGSAGGFSTARGQKIAMPSNAGGRTKNLFADIEAECNTLLAKAIEKGTTTKNPSYPTINSVDDPSTGFQTANQASGFHPANQSTRVQTANKPVGFQTAGGNKVKMSTTVLQSAMKMFGEDFKDLSVDQHESHQSGHKILNPAETAASTSKTANHSVGFRTGRGDNVKMSESVRQNALKIFGESFDDLRSNHNVDGSEDRDLPKCSVSTFQSATKSSGFEPVNQCAGFQTAGGNKVKVNESIRQNAMKMFGENFDDFSTDEQHHQQKESRPPQKSGFLTAGGVNIKVSENNFQKYAEIFDKIEQNNEDDPNTSDFPAKCQTPMNKQMKRTKMFATSTPNIQPNRMAATNMSPITPIHKPKHAAAEHGVLGMNNDEISNLFEEFRPSPPQQYKNDMSQVLRLDQSISGDENDVLNIDAGVKLQRRQCMLKQQAACLKKPNQVHPSMGSICLRKIIEPMQSLKELKCPRKYSAKELQEFGIVPSVIHVNTNNVIKFKFDMWHYYGDEFCRTKANGIDLLDDMQLIMDENSRVGFKELTNAFLSCPSIDPKLIPDHWVTNALKWIIVKLAGMERSYPQGNACKCLTPENVLQQLKYRCDREIDRAERPAIRRIVEQDDAASKRMVLFVSRVVNNRMEYTLELCDGWYSIGTTPLDPVLSKAVQNGKIAIGTKLLVQGAELVGCEEPCHPLEVRSVAFIR